MHDHCPRDGALCATCLRFRTQGLDGTAMVAGQRWGREVRAREPRPIRWWPSWTDARPEAREIAYRRGAGNERHPQVREVLARSCWDAARREYLAPLPPPGTPIFGPQPSDGLQKFLREIDGE